jgi:hypothetical protein
VKNDAGPAGAAPAAVAAAEPQPEDPKMLRGPGVEMSLRRGGEPGVGG